MTTVQQARMGLSHYKAKDEIIIAWWDREWFEEMFEKKIGDEEWSKIEELCSEAIENSGFGNVLMTAASAQVWAEVSE